jgi:flagellar biosynthesis/type III secretory pathway M-ring protein FliF/YscJ
MPALPSADQSKRDEIRDAVEEIANNQPEAIAHQVTAWMKE